MKRFLTMIAIALLAPTLTSVASANVGKCNANAIGLAIDLGRAARAENPVSVASCEAIVWQAIEDAVESDCDPTDGAHPVTTALLVKAENTVPIEKLGSCDAVLDCGGYTGQVPAYPLPIGLTFQQVYGLLFSLTNAAWGCSAP